MCLSEIIVGDATSLTSVVTGDFVLSNVGPIQLGFVPVGVHSLASPSKKWRLFGM